jgi:EmrB/QacA subfamily drug resistance transporter
MDGGNYGRTTTRWIVALASIGSLMAALDTLVVSTALSTIRADLGASVEQLQWTINAYNLSFALLLITAVALGDRFGRRRMYASGLALFAAASAACALAPNVGLLIVGRALQGAGAAMILPLGLALLSDAFPPERRGAAIGIFSAITGIAVALGPVVGGAIVQGLDWHWIFWVNVPIGVVAAPLALAKMRESFGPDKAIDILGHALISAGMFGIVWGLVRGNEVGWGSAEVVTAFAAGAVLSAAFAAWQLRAPAPMIPLGMFRDRSFSAGNVAIFFTLASLFTEVFFFAQFLQTVAGLDPLGVGLRLLPWTATLITIAPLAGAYSDRIGERPLLVTGLTLQAIGLIWLVAIVKTDISYAALLGPFIVSGVGVSIAIPCAQNTVMARMSSENLGKGSGVNSTMRELGGVFGVATSVAVFAANGDLGSTEAFVSGFKPAIGVAAGFAICGAIAGSFVPSKHAAIAAIPVTETGQ